jgi:tRNA A-37 threonylcarbamoyl transferase component Bud32
MQARYRNERVVGSGATACVFLAEEKKSGSTVAIKVAKKLGKLAGWQKECSDMQRLRKRACAQGKEMLSLHENYVPTCIEVGQDGTQAFYVMHAAGINQIKSYTGANALKTAEEKKNMFVQFWASVYALHGVGYTHNDLHGGNIVVDDNNNVALIDFGELKGHHSGKGYKHDINSMWQWSSVILGCTNAEWGLWPQAKLREVKGNFLKCLDQKIGVDSEFIKVMDVALEAAMMNDADQHLKEVFETKFMQSNLPPFKRLFLWSDMDGCLDWDWKKIINQKNCRDIVGFYKCPQESRPGACYSKRGDWNCWREGDDFWHGECEKKGFEGACVYPDHGKSITKPDEVKSCSSLGECANCPTNTWGACYKQDKTGVPAHLQCLCAPPTNTFLIKKSLLKYGCETKRIQGKEMAYDGLCKLDGFKIIQGDQKIAAVSPTVSKGPKMSVKQGQKLQCKTRSGAWKACTVITAGQARAKIRFDGYDKKFDKWIALDSGEMKQ